MALATHHDDTSASAGTFDRWFDDLVVRDTTYFPVEGYTYETGGGGVPNDTLDDRPAIQRAIDDATRAGDGSIVILKAGTYRVMSAQTERPAFTITRADGLTIQGAGNDAAGTLILITNPQAGGFTWFESDNCVIRRLTIDYDPPPFTQGSIIAVGTTSFDWQIPSHFPALEEPGFCPTPAPPGCTGRFGGNWGMVIEPTTKLIKRGLADSLYVASWTKLSTDLDADRLYRITPTSWSQPMLAQMAAGDRFIYIRRNGGTAVLFAFSRNCAAEDIDVRASPVLAAASQGEGPNRFTRFNVRFAPGSDRLLTTNADGVHCQQERFGVTLENSFFEGMADDVINIYHPTYFVYSFTAPDQVVLAIRGFTRLRAGDRLQFIDPKTGIVRGETTAADAVQLTAAQRAVECPKANVTPATGWEDCWRVTLSPPLSGITSGTDPKSADQVYDMDASGNGYVIRNNVMTASRRHGVFAKAANGLIEGNAMLDLGGQAMVIINDPDWPEGPLPRNVTIARQHHRQRQLHRLVQARRDRGRRAPPRQQARRGPRRAGRRDRAQRRQRLGGTRHLRGVGGERADP